MSLHHLPLYGSLSVFHTGNDRLVTLQFSCAEIKACAYFYLLDGSYRAYTLDRALLCGVGVFGHLPTTFPHSSLTSFSSTSEQHSLLFVEVMFSPTLFVGKLVSCSMSTTFPLRALGFFGLVRSYLNIVCMSALFFRQQTSG